MKALITRKIGMTSTTAEDGTVEAITLLSAAPNIITQIKDEAKDGYLAIQLGAFETKKAKKPQAGHLKSTKTQLKVMREFVIPQLDENLKVGETQNADLFSVGDVVHVTATNKGKGFAGTIKRHGMHRGPKSHGGRSYRRIGSIGSMFPQKIFKGKRMAGHMGHAQTTIRNLKIALVDPELQVIGVTGAVPGPKRGIVLVRGE